MAEKSIARVFGSATLSPDGSRVLTHEGGVNYVYLTPAYLSGEDAVAEFDQHTDTLIVWAPDNLTVGMGRRNRVVKVNTSKGRGPPVEVALVMRGEAFPPWFEGGALWGCDTEGEVWREGSPAPVARLGGPVRDLAWGGGRLAVSGGGSLRLYGPGYVPLGEVDAPAARLGGLHLGPSRQLAVHGVDGLVWEASPGGAAVKLLPEKASAVSTFSPSGRLAVAAQGAIRVYVGGVLLAILPGVGDWTYRMTWVGDRFLVVETMHLTHVADVQAKKFLDAEEFARAIQN